MFGFWRMILLSAIIHFFCLPIFAQTKAWTLQRCIDSAFANNLNLQQSAFAVELNRIGAKQSRNNLLPAVNGNAGEALSVGRLVNPVSNLYETGTAWTTAAGITLTQNLFNGLQFLNAIKESDLILKSSQYDLEDVKFNLTVSVVNDFLQMLYASEAIKIAQNQAGADSVQLQTTANMVYVGKKTESDLLQIQSQLSVDNFSVVNAISQWKIAKVNLQQLMNLPVSESFDIDYSAIVEPEQKQREDIAEIYNQSLSFQPIIQSYNLKTQSREVALKIAKGAYYPQLLLKGSIATDYASIAKQSSIVSGSNLENIGYLQNNPSEIVMGEVPYATTKISGYPFANQMSDNINGSISIGLSIPILNYLQVRNNVKKEKVNLENAVVSEQLAKVNLRKTIEQIYTAVENSESQYRSAKEEVDANKAAYEISVAKYEDGKMIASDLILQKNSYIKALSDLLQAKYGLLFNSKILDYYKGVPITF